MTYQVLARKWRPRTFEQLVGQSHITLALTHALKTNRLHHAYLFSGTRGVGKTTVARILAKCLNCEQGVSDNPCGTCDACKGVDEGRFPDLIEVDAASRTKVEDTRELLDNVMYAPSVGRYKIYLIDEVHMLSGHSFNALLKTLEEPPPHVIFLLATTDPQKLPITVLSRCLQFQLRPIAQPLLEKQLSDILTQGEHSFDPQALTLLARAAQGSMRDALSLLEQAIAIGQGQVNTSSVEQMLGCTFMAQLPELLKAICAQDTQAVLSIIEKLYEHGSDFNMLLDAMLASFHAWAVCSALPSELDKMADFSGVGTEAVSLFESQSQEQIQLYYQIALKGKEDLAYAPSVKAGFEMLCLRLMHFRPFEGEVALQVSTAKVAPQQVLQQRPQTQQAPTPVSPPAPAVTQSAPPAQAAQTHVKPQVKKVIKPKPVETPSGYAGDTPNWSDIAQKLQLVGLAKVLVQNCVITQWELPKVKLTLDARQAVCLNDDRKSKIEKALSAHLNQPIDLAIQAGDVGDESPLQQANIQEQVRLTKAQKLLNEDKDAQSFIKTFDAVVENVSLNEDES